MRTLAKKMKKSMLRLESFDSYGEFLNVVESRQDNVHDDEYSLKYLGDNRDKDFTGVSSYDEAKSLLINGWSKKVENFKKEFANEEKVLQTKKKPVQINDVVGFTPNVPNAVLGLPKSMVNIYKELKKTKVIRFLIDNTVSWNVSSNDLIKFYTKVLARISWLEKQGYRCRIEILQTYFQEQQSRENSVAFTCLVKSENQLFDIKRVAFPLAHSGMLRVFGFGWQSCLPLEYDSYHYGGLGTPMYHWSESNRNEVLESIKTANEKIVYVSYGCNIEDMFAKIIGKE